MLIGFAYTNNTQLRPLSFTGSNLHTWPEYYDPQTGWMMIDPTWENTTGGVDYFSKFDLNHLVLAVRGSLSEQPIAADQVEVSLAKADLEPHPSLDLKLEAPSQIFAGFPAQVKVHIFNNGNVATSSAQVKLSTSKLELLGPTDFITPPIPPLGHVDYQFTVKNKTLWDEYNDKLELLVASQSAQKAIQVKPFFAQKVFSYGILGIVGLMLITYILVLTLHLKVGKHKSK